MSFKIFALKIVILGERIKRRGIFGHSRKTKQEVKEIT
jgi:hypothetical protein